MEAEEEEPAEEEETSAPLPDEEEIHRREECYQQLRQVVGVGGGDGKTTPLLDGLQALWTPRSAGSCWHE